MPDYNCVHQVPAVAELMHSGKVIQVTVAGVARER